MFKRKKKDLTLRYLLFRDASRPNKYSQGEIDWQKLEETIHNQTKEWIVYNIDTNRYESKNYHFEILEKKILDEFVAQQRFDLSYHVRGVAFPDYAKLAQTQGITQLQYNGIPVITYPRR